MKDDLVIHSGCLKQQMKTILRVPWWFYMEGTNIDKEEEEWSARVGTYHEMSETR